MLNLKKFYIWNVQQQNSLNKDAVILYLVIIYSNPELRIDTININWNNIWLEIVIYCLEKRQADLSELREKYSKNPNQVSIAALS